MGTSAQGPFICFSYSNVPFVLIAPRHLTVNFSTGSNDLAVATDRQRHEDQESSAPRAHCKCNDPGIVFFLYLFLCSCNAMIKDIKASKHFLIETKNTTTHGKDYDSDSQFTFPNPFPGVSDSLGNGGCTCKFPFTYEGKKWRPKDDGTLCQIALK